MIVTSPDDDRAQRALGSRVAWPVRQGPGICTRCRTEGWVGGGLCPACRDERDWAALNKTLCDALHRPQAESR